MSFNSLHTALEASVNLLLASGLCAEIDLVMSPSFSIEEGRIMAAEYRVECVKPVVGGNLPMTLNFTPPTEREDGSVLRLEEIVGYEIEFDGKCARGWTLTGEGKSSKPSINCFEGDR